MPLCAPQNAMGKSTFGCYWNDISGLILDFNFVLLLLMFSFLVMSSSCDTVDCSHQVPLSMGFPRPECWSGSPFPSPGGLPHQGLTLCLSCLCTGRHRVNTAVPGKPLLLLENNKQQLLRMTRSVKSKMREVGGRLKRKGIYGYL